MKSSSYRRIIAAGNYEQIAQSRFKNADLPRLRGAQTLRKGGNSCRPSTNSIARDSITHARGNVVGPGQGKNALIEA